MWYVLQKSYKKDVKATKINRIGSGNEFADISFCISIKC